MKKSQYAIFVILILIIIGNIKSTSFYANINTEVTYNDNVFNLSDNELDEFRDNINPNQFPYETSDDLVIATRLKLSYYNNFIRKSKTRFSFFYKDYTFSQNYQKNYKYYLFGLKQYYKDLSLELKYKFLPKYFVRHYRDDDFFNEYVPFDFEKDYYYLDFNYDLPLNVSISLGYIFSQSYYNSYFTEFDSESDEYKIGAKYSLPFGIKLAGYYYFTDLEAKGFDSVDEPEIDSDQSFEEDAYQIIVDYKTPKLWKKRISLRLASKIAFRYFQTDNSIENDYFHARRKDEKFNVNISARRDLYKFIDVEVFYEFANRNSFNGYGNELEAKTYSSNKFGMIFTASMRIF